MTTAMPKTKRTTANAPHYYVRRVNDDEPVLMLRATVANAARVEQFEALCRAHGISTRDHYLDDSEIDEAEVAEQCAYVPVGRTSTLVKDEDKKGRGGTFERTAGGINTAYTPAACDRNNNNHPPREPRYSKKATAARARTKATGER